MTKTEKTAELLEKILSEMGCTCEECRGFAWDKVIELEGR